MTQFTCALCDISGLDPEIIIVQNEFAIARWEENPESEGRALVVPKRHVESLFELGDEELLWVLDLAKATKQAIISCYSPYSFNIGILDGEALNQMFKHAYLHIIPLYSSDVEASVIKR